MKPHHYPAQYAKVNSKWIKDLALTRETIRLLEENPGLGELLNIGRGDDFFEYGTKSNKSKNRQVDHLQLQNHSTAKGPRM